MLMTAAFIVGCGAIDVNAQQNPSGTMMQTPDQRQQSPDQGSAATSQQGCMMQGGMMGRGMMGGGMMGPRSMMGGPMGPGGMMNPVAMRIMFALMDADGDGTVSLQEFQTPEPLNGI
jgi:hypothetical protein